MKCLEMDYIKPCNFLDHFNFLNFIQLLNKAKEDISMSKHVLEIKVCCYLL